MSFTRSHSQILAGALLECHEEASKEGHKFALEVFQSGRNRLEDVGATALAQVFQVLLFIIVFFLVLFPKYADSVGYLWAACASLLC